MSVSSKISPTNVLFTVSILPKPLPSRALINLLLGVIITLSKGSSFIKFKKLLPTLSTPCISPFFTSYLSATFLLYLNSIINSCSLVNIIYLVI